MKNKKILFICGTLNQTTMMYAVAQHLQEFDLFYTPFYSDGFIQTLAEAGFMDFCSLGGQARRATEKFLKNNNLQVDFKGVSNDYDLVVTCSDLILPKNIQNKAIIHIQEGMTDPENLIYYMVKTLRLPRYFANTSMMGLSNGYNQFCVLSEGWKQIFINKGVDADRIAVTGVPNFDNVATYKVNDFPHNDYVLAATSALRETFKFENRSQFIKKAMSIANGRKVIFKLHPNEKKDRAVREIKKYAPGAIIYTEGNTNHMIANCHTLITRYSSVVMIAAAMGKKVYSDFAPDELERIIPLQNGGKSAQNIAELGRSYL